MHSSHYAFTHARNENCTPSMGITLCAIVFPIPLGTARKELNPRGSKFSPLLEVFPIPLGAARKELTPRGSKFFPLFEVIILEMDILCANSVFQLLEVTIF